MTPSVTSSYGLICIGAGGAESNVPYVTVEVGSPVIATLFADLTSIPLGGSIALTWFSENATSCTGNSFSTEGATAGSIIVSPTADINYLVTCYGAGGSIGNYSVSITVGPPVTATLGADPATIQQGASTTLTWLVGNAYSCTASSAEDPSWSGPKSPAGGSQLVSPNVNSTYALTCVGGGGAEATAYASVTLCAPGSVFCSIDYVAMGDSYSSGEGAGYGNYVAGTAFNGINACHRAPSAYAPNANLEPNFLLQPDEFLACSGAVIENISIGGPPAAKDGPIMTSYSQLDKTFVGMPGQTVVNEDTDLITITIGGNDIQFDRIVQNCVAGSHCNTNGAFWIADDGRSIQQIADDNGLQTLDGPIETLLNEIRGRAPQASILLLGYPSAVDDAPGAKCEGFDHAERVAANSISAQLNGRLQIAAANAGVHFVDVAAYFENNELCVSAEPYFTGLEGGVTGALLNVLRINFADEVLQQGFHPNQRGHDAYRRAVEDCLQTLIVGGCAQNGAGMPIEPCPQAVSCTGLVPPAAAQSAVATVSMGGALAKEYGPLVVEAISPPPCDTGEQFIAGEAVRITGSGFGPLASVEIRVGSFEETFTSIIGTTAADLFGDLDYTFAIPALFPTGEAGGIGAIGLTPTGAELALSTLIGVAASTASDGDSDTVPDVCDLCPDDHDPLQLDLDGDKIGDECDSCIDDSANDADADGLCADVDPCPLDATNADLDMDGFCNSQDGDDDGDGLSDLWETNTGVFVSATNTGTDPDLVDSDGDGFDDATETIAGSDPNDASDFPFAVPSMRGYALFILALGLSLSVLLIPTVRRGVN